MSRKPRKKKQYDDDDGRTIANMNVEGMPWYHKENRDQTSLAGQDTGEKRHGSDSFGEKITLSAKEGRAMMRGVLLAAFLVGAIFFGVIAIFILFCIYVWFR